MVRGYNLKLVAICLMMLFIFQIAFPTVSFALTGGPSQPEVQGFTPANSSELVDLATGNFNYSIPVMTVPGPNGGESLTLGYTAGATMEQEASWVGLGWDLSVGAINRNLRGLPDDFKGDIIEKVHSQKDREIKTKKISASVAFELLGAKIPLSAGLKLGGNVFYSEDNYYNNYLGFGLNGGLVLAEDCQSQPVFGLNAGLNFSQDGLNIPVGISIGDKLKLSMGANFGGMQSLQSINFGASYSNEKFQKEDKESRRFRFGAGYSFAKSAPVGEIESDIETNTWIINSSFDQSKSGLESYGVGNSRTKTTITYSGNTKHGYGYIYSDFKDLSSNYLLDFHKEKNIPFSDATPTLPVPVYDFDTYSVTGNGVGGVFRAFRSDIGVLTKAPIKNLSASRGGGVQLTNTPAYFGGSIIESKSTTYSGKWSTNSENFNITDNSIGFKSKDATDPLYNPFYFEFIGTQESSNKTYNSASENENPAIYNVYMGSKEDVFYDNQNVLDGKYNIKSRYGKLGESAKNKLKYSKQAPRETTTSHISYKTKEEIIDGKRVYKNILPENKYPFEKDNSGNSYLEGIDYEKNSDLTDPEVIKRKDDHINEMTISSGGAHYVYGLPAYNNFKREIMFSANGSTHSSHNNHLINVPSNYETNTNGFDNLYTEKIIPAYAYSYLLTGKFSDNYVDLLGDGPTKDDLGGWVKYNYSTVSDVKWRGPYIGASYMKGSLSWDEDDKATYTDGEKDIHYLNSVETKTHIAVFELGDREDNMPSRKEDDSFDYSSSNSSSNASKNTDGTVKRSKYLKKITLYSKNDPEYESGDITKLTPIKEANFVYEYELCPNVTNRLSISNNDINHIVSGGTGKLTLKKVYFTHQKNKKGALTPYELDYGTINPGYEYMTATDRWGNYQDLSKSSRNGINSKEFPYTIQEEGYENTSGKNYHDIYAGAWNLNKITMPSGGEIEIEYESDDYSHVQEAQAMQMCEIVGTTTGAAILSADNEQIMGFDKNSSQDYYVFFKGNKSSMTKTEAQAYFNEKESPWLYFNVNVALKGRNSKMKTEMISGYAEVDINSVDVTSAGIGYFKVKPSRFDNGNQAKGFVHPFRKAAIQHYHNRPDFKPKVANVVQQIRSFVKGPVFTHLKKGRGNRLVIKENGINKNLIRLLSPEKKKKGGGYRVKSVKINSGSNTYGQKYSYLTKDGASSSGVADYEPIIGGEENSLRIPVNYNDILDQNSQASGEYFLQKPYLESFYPSPIIRYGRVQVENLTPKDINTLSTETLPNKGGITVYEHYTSKDFPVVEKTPGKSEAAHYDTKLVFPFVPRVAREDNKVFSSGSVVILNNMSGKLKSVSTFDGIAADFINDNYKTKISYKYHTNKDNPKRLDNKVKYYTDDREYEEGLIGQKQEIYVHQEENRSNSRNIDGQANICNVPWKVCPSLTTVKTISQRRTVSTVKLINKVGILKEVVTVDDGRTTTATNLAFDANTGEPLVTKVDNDWDKPVYSYNYSGQWEYPALAGKYKNYRARFKLSNSSSAPNYKISSSLSVEEILQEGDIIRQNNKLFYVTKIDVMTNSFEASNYENSGTLSTGINIDVVKSGYKNLQSTKIGNYVSLTNPLTTVSSGAFIKDVYNKFVNIHTNQNGNLEQYISSCKTLDYNLDPSLTSNLEGIKTYTIPVSENGTNLCEVQIKYSSTTATSIYGLAVGNHLVQNSLKKISKNKYKFSFIIGTKTFVGIMSTDCDLSCPIDVLNASATELKENGWEYNYQDVGNPQVKIASGEVDFSTANVNDYATAKRGNWLPVRSWVYQTDRKQTGTSGDGVKLNKDGEYEKFDFFNWNKPVSYHDDKEWEWTTEITKYSPYGYQIENKNRLEIYSTELYGYDNSVVTAVAVNAAYDEIAYEGFETNNDGTTHTLNGHFTGTVTANTHRAHTGNYSMQIGDGDGILSLPQTNFKTVAGKKYHFSVWMYTRGSDGGNIQILQNTIPLTVNQTGEPSSSTFFTMPTSYSNVAPEKYKDHYKEIDDWTKIEGTFVATHDYNSNNTTSPLIFEFQFSTRTGASGLVAFDDMRLAPANSGIQTYVYNPYTLWLDATLDYNNYATFYRRDNQGKLTIVKTETEQGVVTRSATRENIAK